VKISRQERNVTDIRHGVDIDPSSFHSLSSHLCQRFCKYRKQTIFFSLFPLPSFLLVSHRAGLFPRCACVCTFRIARTWTVHQRDTVQLLNPEKRRLAQVNNAEPLRNSTELLYVTRCAALARVTTLHDPSCPISGAHLNFKPRYVIAVALD